MSEIRLKPDNYKKAVKEIKQIIFDNCENRLAGMMVLAMLLHELCGDNDAKEFLSYFNKTFHVLGEIEERGTP